MKKIYLLLLGTAMVSTCWSQSFTTIELENVNVLKEAPLPEFDNAASDPTDTLGFDDFGDGLFAFGSGSGWLSGTNSASQNGITQQYHGFAAGYDVSADYDVLGAIILFAVKTDVSGSPTDLTVNVNPIEPNSAVSAIGVTSFDTDGPGQALTSQSLPFSDVMTPVSGISIPTVVMFDQSASVSDDFAISVDISGLYGANEVDSIVLFTDSIGDSDGMFSWTSLNVDNGQVDQSNWFKTTGTVQGGFDIHFAIFAIVGNQVGIEEQGYLNGVKMTTYPNPTVSSENFTIQYGLETSVKNVDISIYNMNGQVVHTSALGAKASGVYNLNIPAGTLSAGSYIYSIDADGRRMAKRLEVLK